MNKTVLVFVAMLVVMIGGVCHVNKFQTGPLTPKEFKKACENKQAVIIDVRSAAEYDSSHLYHATNLDVMNGKFERALSQMDTSAAYFLYCKSGKRSDKASGIMKTAGFKKVYTLKGGIVAWKNEKLPVVTQKTK